MDDCLFDDCEQCFRYHQRKECFLIPEYALTYLHNKTEEVTFMLLYSYFEKDQECCMKLDAMASVLYCSKKSVQNALNSFEKRRIIIKEKHNGKCSNTYSLNASKLKEWEDEYYVMRR